jgi:hypothetical protein
MEAKFVDFMSFPYSFCQSCSTTGQLVGAGEILKFGKAELRLDVGKLPVSASGHA